MGVIIYNGLSSKDYGIEVETFPTYQTPRKDYDIYHVPGRNGDVFIDTGAYQNVQRKYDISIGTFEIPYTDFANGLSEWLHSTVNYARLEDSYEPDYYRMAVYEEEMEFSNIYNHGGKATITFNCKPQRYLKIGEDPITVTAKTALYNPTHFTALPIIKVYGSGAGKLVVGNYSVDISKISTSVTINSDIQDAYSGTTNKNSTITLSNGFPKLLSGLNDISFSGGVTKLEVIPNWWTL